MNKINMKEIQQKITTSFFEDGIWDFGIGLIFLCMGLLLYIDMPAFVGVAAAIIVTFIPLFKKTITLPRYGHIQLLQREKRRFSILFLLTFVMGLAFFLVLSTAIADTVIGQFLRSNGLAVIGIVIGGTMALVGFWLRFSRLYFYGVLVAIPFLSADWLVILPIKMITAGGIITLIGVWLIIRFTQRYPKVELPEV